MIGKLWNPFDCDKYCRAPGGHFVAGERAARACTRTDLPRVEWDVDPERLRFYVGRYPDRELGEDWERPKESDDSGCPGGYQRSPLLWGLARYLRHRAEGGQRVTNPLFDRLEDELVIEAVLHFEREQERCIAETERVWAELREEQQKQG